MPTPLPRAGLRTSTATAAELARLHKNALPDSETIPVPFELACWSKPAHLIGGDLLAAWPISRGRLMVFLCDVMGHDVASALIAAAVRQDLFRARQSGVESPAALLHWLDRGVSEQFAGSFVTAASCLLDARAGRLTWSLAGHPPILLRDETGQVLCLDQKAYPLGLGEKDVYLEEAVTLSAGCGVVLYSDGVSDPLGSVDYPGAEVLAGLLSVPNASPRDQVRIIRRAIRAFRRTDDRSVLAVRVSG